MKQRKKEIAVVSKVEVKVPFENQNSLCFNILSRENKGRSYKNSKWKYKKELLLSSRWNQKKDVNSSEIIK